MTNFAFGTPCANYSPVLPASNVLYFRVQTCVVRTLFVAFVAVLTLATRLSFLAA